MSGRKGKVLLYFHRGPSVRSCLYYVFCIWKNLLHKSGKITTAYVYIYLCLMSFKCDSENKCYIFIVCYVISGTHLVWKWKRPCFVLKSLWWKYHILIRWLKDVKYQKGKWPYTGDSTVIIHVLLDCLAVISVITKPEIGYCTFPVRAKTTAADPLLSDAFFERRPHFAALFLKFRWKFLISMNSHCRKNIGRFMETIYT